MEVNYAVHFEVMKGLGPEFVPKTVFVGIDDIEPGTPDYEIKDMVKNDAIYQLKQAGHTRYIYRDMEQC